MAARGPAPTPTAKLKLRGSWRAKERPGEPAPAAKAPPCPDWLPDEAKAEWSRQVKQLLAMGVIAEVDRALLAAYCEAWAEFVKASGELATEELVRLTDKGYPVANPLVSIRNAAVERMVRIAAQFGFSPSARARVKAVDKSERKDDGKGRFFKTVG